jgi:hypothetical protein
MLPTLPPSAHTSYPPVLNLTYRGGGGGPLLTLDRLSVVSQPVGSPHRYFVFLIESNLYRQVFLEHFNSKTYINRNKNQGMTRL